MIYSPHMLETYIKCPQMYFLEFIEGIRLPQKQESFETGKKIHALASYYLQGADISKMEKVLTEKEKDIWENLKSKNYFNFEIINTEYTLSCKIDKYWIGGRLDALVCSKDVSSKTEKKDYYILDYKTGEIPKNAENNFQTITYLLCVDRLLKDYNSLKFVYIGLKDNTEKIIELNSENKKEFEQKITETCKNIELGVFDKNKKTCDFCKFKKLCV